MANITFSEARVKALGTRKAACGVRNAKLEGFGVRVLPSGARCRLRRGPSLGPASQAARPRGAVDCTAIGDAVREAAAEERRTGCGGDLRGGQAADEALRGSQNGAGIGGAQHSAWCLHTREEAGRVVATRLPRERRLLGPAPGRGNPAARVEAAAARRVQRTRRLAAHVVAGGEAVLLQQRRRDQHPRIGVQGALEHRVSIPDSRRSGRDT